MGFTPQAPQTCVSTNSTILAWLLAPVLLREATSLVKPVDRSRRDEYLGKTSPVGGRMPFRITENCTGCTACAKRCPTDAITGDRSMLHVIDPDLCIDCGACGVVCPDEAIWDHTGTLCDFLKSKERPKAFVVEDRCTGCEWCVWSCPFDALYMVNGSNPEIFQKIAEV